MKNKEAGGKKQTDVCAVRCVDLFCEIFLEALKKNARDLENRSVCVEDTA